MKDRMFGNGGIKEDLMKNRFDIKNILKWKGCGQDDFAMIWMGNTILLKNG
jgi:hypothetical protein